MKFLMVLMFVLIATVNAQESNEITVKLVQTIDTTASFLQNNRFMPTPTLAYKQSIKEGIIRVNKNEYRCAVFNINEKKYSLHSFIWIDKLSNGKNDFNEDYIDQLYLPFTIKTITYKVTAVDSLGNYIKIASCNPKLNPPIEIGLIAPNFIAKTITKNEYELYKVKNKYKVVFFWTCLFAPHVVNTEKVVSHFKNLDIDFVTLSDPSNMMEERISWNHIHLNGWEDKLRILYQAGSLGKLLLLDKDNKVLFMSSMLRSDEIIEAIESIIK